jgi:hypothetical protein
LSGLLLQVAARWAALAASAGWACWLARVGQGVLGNKGLGFWIARKGFNSNGIQILNLNSSNQKKCTSMNATIKSYISLTLF